MDTLQHELTHIVSALHNFEFTPVIRRGPYDYTLSEEEARAKTRAP